MSSIPNVNIVIPRERLLLARCLPATFAGRFTGWMPASLCRLRNKTLVVLVIEAAFALASLGLSGVRKLNRWR